MVARNAIGNTFIDSDSFYIASGGSTGCAPTKDAQGINTRNVRCSLGDINPGDSVSKQIQVRPKGNLNQVFFTASVSNDFTDSDSSNNSRDATTSVTSIVHPANDNFVKAAELKDKSASDHSGSISGSNVGATFEQPIKYVLDRENSIEPLHAGQNGGKSVWFYWTPPTSGSGSADVNTIGSDFDTLVSVYSLDTINLTVQEEFASNDDISAGNKASIVYFKFSPNHVYYIVVDGKQGETGHINLNWAAFLNGSSQAQATQSIDVGKAAAMLSPTTAAVSSATMRPMALPRLSLMTALLSSAMMAQVSL